MITPPKGDIVSIPLTLQGQQTAEAWDPARDEAAGERCRAYGAPGLMRGPIRLRIAWQDDNTLKLETDYGIQTRLLHFATAAAGRSAQLAGPHVRAMDRAGGRSRSTALRIAENRDDQSRPGTYARTAFPTASEPCSPSTGTSTHCRVGTGIW